jgi:hypothetical protein
VRPADGRAAVEKVPLDDGGQIGADAAALLELAKDLVVVVDDFEVNGRPKLLDRIRGEAMTAADELDHLIDDGEMSRTWRSSDTGDWRDYHLMTILTVGAELLIL